MVVKEGEGAVVCAGAGVLDIDEASWAMEGMLMGLKYTLHDHFQGFVKNKKKQVAVKKKMKKRLGVFCSRVLFADWTPALI